MAATGGPHCNIVFGENRSETPTLVISCIWRSPPPPPSRIRKGPGRQVCQRMGGGVMTMTRTSPRRQPPPSQTPPMGHPRAAAYPFARRGPTICRAGLGRIPCPPGPAFGESSDQSAPERRGGNAEGGQKWRGGGEIEVSPRTRPPPTLILPGCAPRE